MSPHHLSRYTRGGLWAGWALTAASVAFLAAALLRSEGRHAASAADRADLRAQVHRALDEARAGRDRLLRAVEANRAVLGRLEHALAAREEAPP